MIPIDASQVSRLDHITVIAPTLEAGAAHVEAALGVRPGAGSKHPGMGTHNLRLALGPDVYLEVIAVDPDGPSIGRPRWFGLDRLAAGAGARLAAWVASTDDIESATFAEIGEVEQMHRAHHTWKMAVRADGQPPLGGAVPLLIQRSPNVSPAAALPPSGLLLRRLCVRHPAPAEVETLFDRIALASHPCVVVTENRVISLVAEIETPWGLRELGTHGQETP